MKKKGGELTWIGRPEFFLWVDVLDNWPLDIGRGDVFDSKDSTLGTLLTDLCLIGCIEP